MPKNLEIGMLLSYNNKKAVRWFTDDPDISPALSQSVTPASDMADSHYAMWQQQTVPTQRCFITHWRRFRLKRDK